MNEKITEVRRDIAPQWDEVRHRRNWKMIEKRICRHAEASSRAEHKPDTRWFIKPLFAAACGLAAAAVLLTVFWILRTSDEKQPVHIFPQTTPGYVTRVFSDGSHAVLEKLAKISVIEQSEERVEIKHSAGTVRYHVKPDRKSSFVVSTPTVEIRVLGTVFTVSMTRSNDIFVSVARGRVMVRKTVAAEKDDPVVLEAGESAQFRADPERVEKRHPSDDESETDEPEDLQKDGPDPGPPPSTPPMHPERTTDVDDLLRQVDNARRSGNNSEAARLLRRIISGAPGDPRVSTALFTLGRVETSRGRHAAAARAFRRCRRMTPYGSLAEDALAAEAQALRAAGRSAAAQKLAQKYLQRYPQGTHVKQMRSISE